MTASNQTTERPSTGKRIVRYLVIAAALVFVFGWLLPQIIDYELIWEAITGLTLLQLLVLSALTIIRIPTEAMIIAGISLAVAAAVSVVVWQASLSWTKATRALLLDQAGAGAARRGTSAWEGSCAASR